MALASHSLNESFPVKKYDPDADIESVLFEPTLYEQMQALPDGRVDLPIRVLTGYVENQVLIVDRLLNYAQHVAIFGLIATGLHRHESTLRVVSRSAGAFQGDLAAFDKWRVRTKLQGDAILTTTLADGTPWIIWQKYELKRSSVVPMVHGWDIRTRKIFPLEERLSRTEVLRH